MSIVRRIKNKLGVINSAIRVRSEYRKSFIAQVFEMIALRFYKNKVGVDEYFEFMVYDDKYTNDMKRSFVGWRKETSYGEILNHKTWNVVTNDKLTAYAIFSGLNLPYPKISVLYHPYKREFPGAVCLSEPAELAAYLRNGISFPFFSKPVHGASGRNSVACIAYEESSDSLVLGNGNKIDVEEYVAACHPRRGVYPWEAGFIFQELVKPSSDIADLLGNVVPGMRLIVLNPDGDPKIHRAILKIPTGDSMTDNFGKVGETGTIIAELDPETGTIVRAQHGIAPNIRPLDAHPETGTRLVGFQIPNWDQYLKVLFYATKAFPGVRLQHWDIAVSDSGPVIFEMNTFGGFGLPQIATRKGFCDHSLKAFLSKLGEKYPAYKK